MADDRHRSTLKQSNKAFKAGKHSTKGQLKRSHKKDKTAVAAALGHRESIRQKLGGDAKINRRNRLKQERDKKKQLITEAHRLGSKSGPPKIVALIPMTPGASADELRNALIAASLDTDIPNDQVGPVTVRYANPRHRLTLISVPRAPMAILHAAKVADVVAFVFSAVEDVDEAGLRTLSLILAQGQPAVVGVVQGLDELKPKFQLQRRKVFQSFLKDRCAGEPKLFEVTPEVHMQSLLRSLSTMRGRDVQLREHRPYLVVDNIAHDAETNAMRVWGYLRGHALSPKRLVHFSEFGTFQIEAIALAHDPRPMRNESDEPDEEKVLQSSQPDQRDSLMWERIPPEGEVEMADVDSMPDDVEDPVMVDLTGAAERRRVPKGTSEYQSDWYNALEDGDVGEADDDECAPCEDAPDGASDAGGRCDDAVSVATGRTGADSDDMLSDAAYDAKYGNDGEGYLGGPPGETPAQMLARLQSEDFQWPDEVQLPPEGPLAKDLFKGYRGLKSFNRSAWDPYQMLPVEYSKIVSLENFSRTEQVVLEEAENDGVQAGVYVRVDVVDVPAAFMERFNPVVPLVLFGLLRHEHQLSVSHCAVTRHPSFTDALESGTELIVHYGFRILRTSPILSGDNPRSDKNKHERYYQPGQQVTASFYAPIHFGGCPVLFFRETPSGIVLVATGALKNIQPTRLIIKRALITGLPSKIHKKRCVVRKMFYHVEDVMYFKKIELTTKYGRHGHTRCALGTHGHFKAQFDGTLRSDDTICMPLYIRVYPKWGTEQQTCTSPPLL